MKKLLTIIAAMIICNAYGENVLWLDTDNTIYDTTSCTTSGNITPPTTPTKSGYRFMGWREATDSEKVALVSSKLVDDGTSYSPTGKSSDPTWVTTFSWGTVTGEIGCFSTSGSCNSTQSNCTTSSNPSTSGTRSRCWCKATSLTTDDYTIDFSSLKWVYITSQNTYNDCTMYCQSNCAAYFQVRVGFRKTLFGIN